MDAMHNQHEQQQAVKDKLNMHFWNKKYKSQTLYFYNTGMKFRKNYWYVIVNCGVTTICIPANC